jgi:hypothetical protein
MKVLLINVNPDSEEILKFCKMNFLANESTGY